MADLHLNASQQAVYDRMRGELKADLDRFAEGRADFREEVRREMAGPDPDARGRGHTNEGRHGSIARPHGDPHWIAWWSCTRCWTRSKKQQVLDHMRGRMDRCGS